MSTLALENRLSDSERETLLAQFDRDGYFVLPQKLPAELIADCIAAIDRITAEEQRKDAGRRSVKKQNCVELDPAFLKLTMYEPALQLAYDVFGPMFHLCQSNFVSRAREEVQREDFISGAPWHADGPMPNLFPRVPSTYGPAMGLHYLKFGYFLTDLTHGKGGSLQVVRGSHRRDAPSNTPGFDLADYADEIVQFDCRAGTAVAFHQALWHAAPPNESDIIRKNLYISYCPTWMRPFDRDLPSEEQLAGLSDEERWLLGEPRPATRWWLPNSDDVQRMARFKRDGEGALNDTTNYE